ncbi:hypothetical protein [Sphingobium chlorophenolicum]|uniref:DUF429 domain-containing protein n=1 Tax=Sphingobium chlorophenolicum TaxID=46429 RepID=A0A081RG98_SPHCR|nr:hypothetical protein [Sphingobium chlorophenolicum]KEQ54221.1 hypothetical protein BV95_01510 [Sphingobium chlorophenolicum]
MTPRFDRYAVIDWSGAKGSRHKGIAVALCETGDAVPVLQHPEGGGFWSRRAVADWLIRTAREAPTLFGFDFSFAPPYVARRSYLPGDEAPDSGPAFWAYVDSICEDDDLGAASLLERTHRRHFYFGKADGVKADYMHNRACEAHYNTQGGGKPSTVYDAIGAAQVAKASFAGKRLLHYVHAHVPVWPFDPPPPTGSLIVEIYTSIAARAAGRPKGKAKMRDLAALNDALFAVESQPHPGLPPDDHGADAILTAAWLRRAAPRPGLWTPAPLNAEIAATEGWTFGII